MGRLSKEDWIEGAIRFLAEHSVHSLRLELLATQLGVTKGSFYWHFSSRAELLDSVLDTWRARNTRNVQVWLEKNEEKPAGQIRRLLRTAVSTHLDTPGGPLELTFRDWGRRDARVREIVEQVDRDRLTTLTGLYARAGLSAGDAEAYAIMHLTFVIGGRSATRDDPATIEERYAIAERYLVPEERTGAGAPLIR